MTRSLGNKSAHQRRREEHDPQTAQTHDETVASPLAAPKLNAVNQQDEGYKQREQAPYRADSKRVYQADNAAYGSEQKTQYKQYQKRDRPHGQASLLPEPMFLNDSSILSARLISCRYSVI
ncbi:hypothetical protein C7293_16575 [filamentous cyanobacterium CCT1]|nr:hypothetical protein C7293_16575 [filamentous cyanobacterium CCT1]